MPLCDVDNSCLIIIDVQEKLTAAIPDKVIKRLRKNTDILLQAANQLAVPVIATAQYPKGLGPIEEPINSKLDKTNSQYYEKTCFSCLGATNLPDHLSQLNKKQLILTGIESHICVLQSAFDFLSEGYDVFVASDAIASREFASYETALTRLHGAGVNLLNTESILFEWLRDATHPEFRTLSKLIA